MKLIKKQNLIVDILLGRKIWILRLIVFQLIFPLCSSCFASTLLIQGEGQHYMFDTKSGELTPKSKFSFRAEVDHCKWKIETKSLSNPNSPLKYVDYSDGTNVGSQIITLNADGTQKGVAETIDSGVKLIDGSPWSAGVWFAFCSGCYFKTNTNTITPIWKVDPEIRAMGYVLDTRAVFQKGDTHLPSSVEALNPGYYWAFGVGRSLKKIPYNKPYENGFCEYKFFVDRFRNVSGAELAEEFYVVKQAPKRNGSDAKDLNITYKTVYLVKDISQVADSNGSSGGANQTRRSVVDRRFMEADRKVEKIEYITTNASFESMQSPMLESLVANRYRDEKRMQKVRRDEVSLEVSLRKRIQLFIVFASVGVFLMLFYMKQVKS